MKLARANTTTCYEDELLICCARVSQSAQVRDRIEQLLNEHIDWQLVLDRSWWHRIRPLAHIHLSDQPAGQIPVGVLEAFATQASELKQRNLRLMEMLTHVSELCEDASLPMLTFKGPTLAMDAYGDLGLRECGDLDLLIRLTDFPRVKEVLAANGFACMWDQVDSDRKRQLFACEFKRDGIELDIHWDLAPKWHNYDVNFDLFWESGTPVRPNHQFVRKLCPEDSLEVLCMHGTRHWWDRLRWICDIAELVNSGLISEWNRVETNSAKAHCHRSVWLGLWLAGELLGTELPPEIHEKVEQSRVIKQLAAQVGVWLENGEHAADQRKLPDRFLFRMRLCERWRDRLPQLAHYLVTLPTRSANWNP